MLIDQLAALHNIAVPHIEARMHACGQQARAAMQLHDVVLRLRAGTPDATYQQFQRLVAVTAAQWRDGLAYTFGQQVVAQAAKAPFRVPQGQCNT